MKLNTLGKNQTELTINNKKIFFSYNTPVVVEVEGKIYVKKEKFSKTTSEHIVQYLQGRKHTILEASEFELLAKF